MSKPSRASQPNHDAAEELRARGHRLGKVRREVLEALQGLNGPISADDLALQIPDVHVSNIYRTLNLLEEYGVVRHVHLAHRPAMFELAEQADRVRYMVCDNCDRVIQVNPDTFDDVRDRILKQHNFILDTSHFALHGHCQHCAPPENSGLSDLDSPLSGGT